MQFCCRTEHRHFEPALAQASASSHSSRYYLKRKESSLHQPSINRWTLHRMHPAPNETLFGLKPRYYSNCRLWAWPSIACDGEEVGVRITSSLKNLLRTRKRQRPKKAQERAWTSLRLSTTTKLVVSHHRHCSLPNHPAKCQIPKINARGGAVSTAAASKRGPTQPMPNPSRLAAK